MNVFGLSFVYSDRFAFLSLPPSSFPSFSPVYFLCPTACLRHGTCLHFVAGRNGDANRPRLPYPAVRLFAFRCSIRRARSFGLRVKSLTDCKVASNYPHRTDCANCPNVPHPAAGHYFGGRVRCACTRAQKRGRAGRRIRRKEPPQRSVERASSTLASVDTRRR